MTNTYTLSKIDHIVEIGTTLTRSWFRGHSKIFKELTPGIFRKKFDNPIYSALRPDAEFSIIESFKRKAPSLTSKLPEIDDHISWLFLMQHHGSPTRLLDWTKNALVGLYFAINQYPSEDGELWALFPEALNDHNGFFGLPIPNCKTLKYLAAEPSHNNPGKLVKELKLEQRPKYPLAIDPPLHFSRMVSQLSTFTIHPRPEERCKIPDVMTDENHLVRYIIPARCKKGLLMNLAALGITKVTLFPDLDSLSVDIIQEHNVVAYSPPDPPKAEEINKGGNTDVNIPPDKKSPLRK